MIRTLVFWAILIFLAGGAYTLFGILTFEPERPPPLQFDSVETLIARNQDEAKAKAGGVDTTLSPADEQRKMKAVTEVQQVVAEYEAVTPTLPVPAVPIMQVLTEYTRTGALPPRFVDAPDRATQYQFDGSNVMNTIDNPGPLMNCEGNVGLGLNPEATVPATILIGNETANSLTCTAAASQASTIRMFLGGPGDDQLTNAGAAAVFVPGSGNDKMQQGSGAALVYLEEGWGNDTLAVDCASAQLDQSRIPADLAYPWHFQFRHFLIFSPRIAEGDIAWDPTQNSLKNVRTGDTLTTSGKCLNMIFLYPSAAEMKP